VLLPVVSAIIVLAALPGSALADNDNRACELMPTNHGLEKAFGLPHVIEQKNRGGGTDDNDGAFTSVCNAYLYKKKSPPGVDPFGRPPKLKVRRGFAKLQVTATVQEEGPEGDNWDPDAIRLVLLTGLDAQVEAGTGHLLQVPTLGATFAQGLVFGTEADNADGIWQDGEDGVLVMDVQSHGSAAEHLISLAPPVVYGFES
jgi:hypothetical protein